MHFLWISRESLDFAQKITPISVIVWKEADIALTFHKLPMSITQRSVQETHLTKVTVSKTFILSPRGPAPLQT